MATVKLSKVDVADVLPAPLLKEWQSAMRLAPGCGELPACREDTASTSFPDMALGERTRPTA
jgi:hypothetical protein